jgi:hypothetical protein
LIFNFHKVSLSFSFTESWGFKLNAIPHYFSLVFMGYVVFSSVAMLGFVQAYYILDEILIAGELQESSKKNVARLIAAQV